MKKPVLILFALLALLSFAPSMAQTPSAAVPAANPAANPAATSAPDAAAFLATLWGPTQAPGDQAPAPTFLTGGCNVTGLCPRGEICCFLCGNPPEGDDSGCWGCVPPEPVKGGGCPQVY